MSFRSLIKGITPENLHAVFSPNKQSSFEPFMCLDLKQQGPSLRSWRKMPVSRLLSIIPTAQSLGQSYDPVTATVTVIATQKLVEQVGKSIVDCDLL